MQDFTHCGVNWFIQEDTKSRVTAIDSQAVQTGWLVKGWIATGNLLWSGEA